MKTIYSIALSLLWCLQVQAQQNAVLSGKLQDTTDFKSVAYATIMVINPADSTIIKFTRAKDDGKFQVKDLPAGKLRLLVTHPGYADFEDFIELQADREYNIGTINMISRLNLLKEVIIKDKLEAIRIKGDTTEFLVDSFLTKKESNVEDLLKNLPGIQVDKDGKITAQGKEVKKVLVDGEEFFGDDPTIATKNIKAKQVESIQVYDKKSEQATITGVDDGVKEKTINLKLKEDAKKGYFGKVTAGLGTESRYEHEAMFNKFNKKQKISVYGAMSNTNKTSLSWEDSRKYEGDDNNMEVGDDGTMYFYNNSDENDFDGVGVPQTWYTGAHFSDKYKGDKHTLSFNASHKDMNVEGFDSNYTQYILPDTLYFNNDINRIRNTRNGNQFQGSYVFKVDSLSTIKVKFAGAQSQYLNRSNYTSENRNELQQLINSNSRSKEVDGENLTVNSSISFVKKFSKKGRSLSTGITQDYADRNSETLLTSGTSFYADLVLVKQDTINQKRTNEGIKSSINFNTSYTEPLGTKFFWIVDYSITNTKNKSALLTLGKGTGQNYEIQLDSLSNDFRYDVTVNNGGTSFKYQFKKITASIGARAAYTDLYQNNLINKKDTTQRFLNIFPSARFVYKVGTTSNFEISYNGRTRQPSLQQIQPVLDNTNPLDVYIGNDQLGQSFTNNVSLNYNSYKPISGSGIWSNCYLSQTNNDFARNDFVDSLGRRVHQTINVNGNQNMGGQVYYWFNIKKLKLSVSTNARLNLSKNVNVVNNQNNINRNGSYTFGTDFSHSHKDDKYYVSIGGDWTYNTSSSSIRPDVLTQFWIQAYQLNGEVELPAKFELNASATYNIRQRTSEFDRNLNTMIINAELVKKFGEKEIFEIGLSCRDILNQNIGFNRNANSNFINENVHTVLRRYFLLRLTYNINSANRMAKEEDKK